MKITAFITADAIQFNLEPEGDHEKEMMAALAKYDGEVSIHRGVEIAESRGGYVRDYGHRRGLTAITIHKPKEKPEAD